MKRWTRRVFHGAPNQRAKCGSALTIQRTFHRPTGTEVDESALINFIRIPDISQKHRWKTANKTSVSTSEHRDSSRNCNVAMMKLLTGLRFTIIYPSTGSRPVSVYIRIRDASYHRDMK
ncbi:unnamed protein product, partial [Nesidiocoris tenuis]